MFKKLTIAQRHSEFGGSRGDIALRRVFKGLRGVRGGVGDYPKQVELSGPRLASSLRPRGRRHTDISHDKRARRAVNSSPCSHNTLDRLQPYKNAHYRPVTIPPRNVTPAPHARPISPPRGCSPRSQPPELYGQSVGSQSGVALTKVKCRRLFVHRRRSSTRLVLRWGKSHLSLDTHPARPLSSHPHRR